ncbi:MAG: tetratricopeptide repeat protein [bacterium]|nr:tetratricopeptide repeat protein [bacterium]
MEQSNFVKKLLRRRVPQIMAAYLGGGLAFIPFVGFLVETYDLPRVVLNAAFVAYISLAPSVFLLAYNHGAPGKDPWVLAERVGVPVNLILAAGLMLYTIFYTGEVEAMTETVVITDDAGNQQERLVPKAKYRRKLALYFWANESGDESLDWLRYGFPRMLERDLEQNRFITASTPFSDPVLTRLQRAGYDDALAVPVALQQEIAEDLRFTVFVDGRFGRDGDLFNARIALYDTETAQRLAEHAVEGEDPAALVDELTDRLKAALEIEDVEGLGRDLPVQEQLSASREALEIWVEGSVVEELANDRETALGLWNRAVEADPSFALAHRDIAIAHYGLGRPEDAKAALRVVQKHKYRLTERDQFYLRGLEAELEMQTEKSIQAFETLAKIYPDDVTALRTLAGIYAAYNKIDESIATYQRILALDATEDWALKEIGDLHSAHRDYPSALAAYQDYAEGHPSDAEIQFSIAQLQRAEGDLEGARETIEQASVLTGDRITPALILAQIDQAVGDLDAAARRLREAEAEASAPQDLARVLGARINLLAHRGQIRNALELMSRLREVQLQFLMPIQVNLTVGFQIPALHGMVGNEQEAEAWIANAVKKLNPPYDRFGHLFYLQLYTLADNAEGIEAHLEQGRAAMEALSPREDTRAQVELYRGRGLELRGRAAEAAAVYREVLDSFESSTINLISNEVRAKSLVMLSRASIDAGELDVAAESLAEVLRTIPAYPLAKVQMARLEQARGDIDASRAHLAVALDIWAEADADFLDATKARALRDELGS